MQIIRFMRAHTDRKVICLFSVLMFSVVGYGIYLSGQRAQAINLRAQNNTMNQQKYYYNVTNLTQSLIVSGAWYTEHEVKIPSSAKTVTPPRIYKDHSFAVTNPSTKTIDAIIVVFRRNGAINRIVDKYYRQSSHGLKPQESAEVQIQNVEPDLVGTIEVLIFRDGTYEGNPMVAEMKLAHYEAMNAKIVELVTLFQERGLLLARTDMVIPSNVKEMKVLVRDESGRYKAKTNFYDARDAEQHRGNLNGLHIINAALTQIEQNPRREIVRHFIDRMAEITGTESFEKLR